MKYIDKSIENKDEEYVGSIQGYVVSKSDENWKNYLDREVSDRSLREFLTKSIIESSVDSIAIILNVNVEDNYRGNGYGNDLMGIFFDEAEGSQITLLVSDNCETQQEKFKLIHWYEGFGFQKLSICENESTTLMVMDDYNLLCNVSTDLMSEYLKQKVETPKRKRKL